MEDDVAIETLKAWRGCSTRDGQIVEQGIQGGMKEDSTSSGVSCLAILLTYLL